MRFLTCVQLSTALWVDPGQTQGGAFYPVVADTLSLETLISTGFHHLSVQRVTNPVFGLIIGTSSCFLFYHLVVYRGRENTFFPVSYK